VRETALETLAENLNDSVVAPLFWFAVAGLPGAALYRFANTADAMWGYPGHRAGRCWTWAGKWTARADDALSWVPARLTAMVLILAAGRLWMPGLRSEAVRTPSPNGGWPMGALALLLGVRLGKPDVYVLNAAGRAVLPQDIPLACDWSRRALACGVLVCGVIAGASHV
jgi:adenosylcobinamide-phosphate synthase